MVSASAKVLTNSFLQTSAACCGLYACRPTRGTVSRAGMALIAGDLDSVAWLCRTPSLLPRLGDAFCLPGKVQWLCFHAVQCCSGLSTQLCLQAAVSVLLTVCKCCIPVIHQAELLIHLPWSCLGRVRKSQVLSSSSVLKKAVGGVLANSRSPHKQNLSDGKHSLLTTQSYKAAACQSHAVYSCQNGCTSQRSETKQSVLADPAYPPACHATTRNSIP